MNRLLFILLAALLCTSVQSQNYFNERYDTHASWDAAGNVIEVDNGYYVVGFSYDSLWWYQNVLVMFIDTVGNVIWKKEYGEPYYLYYNGARGSFVPTTDGGFVLFGGIKDTTGNSDAMLFRFNSLGDTLWTKKYGDAVFQTGAQCKQTKDNGFVLIGTTATFDADGDYWLIKTDNLGNVEWEKTFGGGLYEYGVSVDTCMDGGYILTGATMSYGPGLGIYPNIYVVKVDSLGNEQWNKVFGGPYTDWVWSIEQTSDGGYITGGSLADSEPSVGSPLGQPYIIKLDSAGNTEWDKPYGPIRYNNGLQMIRELNDGSIIATGATSDDTSQYFGVVIKVDALGDSLWYRTYQNLTGGSSINFLSDIQHCSDGGFIAAGWLLAAPPDTGTQDIWVLKLDSMGMLTGVIEIPWNAPQADVWVYPNPASERFTIEGNYGLPAVLELYDVMGRKVREFEVRSLKFEVDVQGWSRGIYLYRLMDSSGRVMPGKVIIG